MKNRRATIVVACLLAGLGLLILTLPLIVLTIALIPTVIIVAALTLRELHDSLRRQRVILETKGAK
jgi:hypothetical protein